VRGYRNIKKGLQRKLSEIEADRRQSHFQLPELGKIAHEIVKYLANN